MVAQPHDEFDGLALGENEDRILTLAFQAGDKGAYQAIYDRHHARVHGVCRRMLINKDDAEEAAQETFLRVYQALGRFNGRYQLGAWVTRIATNVCLDHLRAKTRRGGDLAALELSELDLCTEDEGPESLVVRNSEGWRVRKVIASLPPLHRAAIVLRDFEGLSYDEVATTLGITDQQVKALLHRARQRFKRNWISAAASALIPWRLIDRLRHADTVAHESVGVQGVSTFAQIAPACSNAFHQCGQYVTERLAPAFAAVLLGGATAAALGPSPAPAHTQMSTDDKPQRHVAPTFDRTLTNEALSRNDGSSQRGMTTEEQEAETLAPPPSPSEEEETPTVEPQPTEAPAPSDSSNEGTGGSDTSEGTIEGEAQPKVVRNAYGFNRGTPIPWSENVAPAKNVDCAAMTFEQHLDTKIWDRDKSYPLSVDLLLRPSGLSAFVTIVKDDYTVTYPAALYLVSSSSSADQMDLAFKGTYGTHPDADRAGLPHSGSVTAEFTLDCLDRAVINESMTFGVESDSHNS